MTLAVGVRHEVRGVLRCVTPIHVGGWEGSATADLAVTRDGLGHPVIPGTSIAGALRAWLSQLPSPSGDGEAFAPATIEAIFGYVRHGEQEAAVSRIAVDDAQLVADRPGEADTVVVRDGVGIDRRTGAAATGFLYEREVLPVGTRFGFRLTADAPPERAASDRAPSEPAPSEGVDPARLREAVAALVAGLSAGRIPIGAGRTRGLGMLVLDDVEVRRHDLASVDGLRAWLTRKHARAVRAEATALLTEGEPHATADGYLEIDVNWQPVGSVLVKDSLEGVVVDAVPLTEADVDGAVRLLLPGSSIKGVLRAHAERIVRTLRDVDADPSLRRVLEHERLDGVVGLFGAAPVRGAPGSQGRRGALVIPDCLSQGSTTRDLWRSVLTAHADATDRTTRDRARQARDAEKQALGARLAALNADFAMRVGEHVAIDRWTGGAADSLLFSEIEPQGVRWDPIRLRLDVRQLARASRRDQRQDQRLALVLLLLVLRDLRDGWLTLGFGGTRGHGHVAVASVTFAGTGLGEPWASMTSLTLNDVIAAPPAPVAEAVEAWRSAFPTPPAVIMHGSAIDPVPPGRSDRGGADVHDHGEVGATGSGASCPPQGRPVATGGVR